MNQPNIIYHYCSASAFNLIIQNKNIRLSSVLASNDAAEGRLIGDVVRKYCEKLSFKSEKIDKVCELISAEAHLNQTDCLTFCLSEERDLLSQWQMYGEQGHGFCIGFDFEKIQDAAKNQADAELIKVVYDEYHVSNELEEIIISFYDANNLIDIINILAPNIKSILKERYKIKNESFFQEKEWRLMNIIDTGSYKNCNFMESNGYIKPFMNIEIEPAMIDTIILGPRNVNSCEKIENFAFHYLREWVSVLKSKSTFR